MQELRLDPPGEDADDFSTTIASVLSGGTSGDATTDSLIGTIAQVLRAHAPFTPALAPENNPLFSAWPGTVWEIDDGSGDVLVRGRSDTYRLPGDGHACPCSAGMRALPACEHRAALARYREEQSSRGR